MQSEHLQVFDLILTVRAPLCVGSGVSYQKNEYLFDSRTKRVSILDRDAFINLMARRNLVDAYERFILTGGSLNRFLREECRLTDTEINGIVRYSLSAADALSDNTPLREIQAFQRDSAGRAYIPGSGIKGALRTAYLLHCILADESYRPGSVEEGRYMNVLDMNGKRRQDAVNDIFRGVRVSDSLPIEEKSMILAGKMDAFSDGSTNNINVCRECLRPGEKVRFRLTLDQAILRQRIDKEILLQCIAEFSKYYRETYLRHFKRPKNDSGETYQNCLLLGAGAGFFSKTVVYPYCGEQRGLKQTAAFMQKKFPKGHHERDEQLGVSPHTIKYTQWGGKMYPVGVCGVDII